MFSEGPAKKASREDNPVVDFRVFMDKHPAISTDRLDRADIATLTSMADSEIPPDRRQFYGWAVVTSEIAGRNGRRVEATPRAGNDHHADIHLPSAAIEDMDIRKQHANELAVNAIWLNRSVS